MDVTWLDPAHPTARQSLELLRDLIEERVGIHFTDQNLVLLADRLAPLALQRDLYSFLDYYYFLKYDPLGSLEWPALCSAITINETYFWREPDALEMVANVLIPELQASIYHRPIRIWHAACATGEEPFSMALALARNQRLGSRVEILATDLDRQALDVARAGRYRERAIRLLPPDLREQYFTADSQGNFQLSSFIQDQVQFRELNLADPTQVSTVGRHDIIFCRNVLIYFRDVATRRLARQFFEQLQSPGYLFLGASESLLRYTQELEFGQRLGVILYKKAGPPA